MNNDDKTNGLIEFLNSNYFLLIFVVVIVAVIICFIYTLTYKSNLIEDSVISGSVSKKKPSVIRTSVKNLKKMFRSGIFLHNNIDENVANKNHDDIKSIDSLNSKSRTVNMSNISKIMSKDSRSTSVFSKSESSYTNVKLNLKFNESSNHKKS